MRLLRTAGQASQAGLKVTWEWGKETGFFYRGYGWSCVRIPTHGQGFTWFHLPRGAKGGSTLAFLLAFPDVGQEGKKRSALKYQKNEVRLFIKIFYR